MSVTLEVDAGACQMRTVIRAREEGGRIALDIDSDCPMVRKLASELGDLDPLDCVSAPISKNPVICAADDCIKHASCPVPTAIIKAAEACCGLAVKKDVSMAYSSSSM